MDTTQPRRGLKAFFKHATIRIASHKDHGFSNDYASTHSIDDDGRSQRSSISGKKDSKLRRIGRGIREWRSKRKRAREEIRSRPSFNLEGKSFSSSEASLPEGSFKDENFSDEDFSDEDEPVDRSENHACEESEGWRREAPEKLPCEVIHEEVAEKQDARKQHVTSDESQTQTRKEDVTSDESQTQSRKELTLSQASSTTLLPPQPIYSSLSWTEVAPRERKLQPTGVVFRRDRKDAFDFAQNTLSNEPALWTDASYRPLSLESCDPLHRGGIAVAQKRDQRWTVHSAYTSGLTKSMHLELLAILMALQRAAQEKRAGSGTLGEGTVYICSDNDYSLRWIEKSLAIAAAIGKVVQEAGALEEADADDLKRLVRFSEHLDQWEVFRFSDYRRPEKNMAASIGRRILEQYYELRRLGVWVEFHWVPAHSGLPGNEIADRVASLACCWVANVAPRPAPGTALVMPLRVLTFDEPWRRYCPHKGQRQYNEYMALQLLEETKNLRVVISSKAISNAITGPASCNTAIVGPVGPAPDGLTLQPAPERTGRLLPSARPFPENGEAKLSPSNPPVAFEVQQQLGPIPQPQPPPTLPPPPPCPQPQTEVRGKKQQKKRSTLLCVHCRHRGHLIQQCFEKFPEQKVALPQRYARYVGRRRLEKVMPGAFDTIARLHPQLMPRAVHGQDSRYMLGRVGLAPHLTPGQCAVWAVRYQAAQPGREDAAAAAVAGAAQPVQDYRWHLRGKYRWDEAQAAQPD